MRDIMLDLETLGTKPGCAVLSIGAVFFDPHGLHAELHTIIRREDCRLYGLEEDERTVRWWADKSAEARKTLDCAGNSQLSTPMLAAMKGFDDFCRMGGEDVRVWGNGADFDQPILAAAWYACHAKNLQRLPWKPWSGRCYRTLKNLRPAIKLDRLGTYHHALDDAKSQALHAIKLLDAVGGWEPH